jgi:hypothetical protein
MSKYHNHVFDPKSINFPANYDMNVENLKLNDMRTAIYYYMSHGMVREVITEEEMEYIYCLTQGNWRELLKDLIDGHRLRPNLEMYELRKKEQKYYDSLK